MAKTSSKRRHALARQERRIPRSRLQYGALCYRVKKGKLRILLISSRRTRRWVTPKGWPMHGKTGWEAAAQEAWEEAGVRGKAVAHSLGFYSYAKYLSKDRYITCTVQIFPLAVETKSRDFPERAERRRKWMRPRKAMEAVDEPELSRMIRKFARNFEKAAKTKKSGD
ncbi:NUDIX hydrolase [Halovulum dunhuangense]|uniref:NUDIX hydrolase n=1 Tax=Halovulum dunhuangense TaxID=1505036 RepID=A0A849L0P5_9RHOB|nr:NUDIX hydrolase [Halovulum dunhuangense]NNU79837.1 NUDIX hydrolase [Halovulum dunhuangense]